MITVDDLKVLARNGKAVIKTGVRAGEWVPGHEQQIGGAWVVCQYHRSYGGAAYDRYQWSIDARAVSEADIERWIGQCGPKFEITEGDGGQKFRIWRDGRIEPHR